MIHRWSIARRLFVANLLIVLAFIAVVGTATFVDARDQTYERSGPADDRHRHLDRGQPAGAAGGGRRGSLAAPAALRPRRHGRTRDADFITIMAPDRTRWTHPRRRGARQALHRVHRCGAAGRDLHRGHRRHPGPLGAHHCPGQGRGRHGPGPGGRRGDGAAPWTSPSPAGCRPCSPSAWPCWWAARWPPGCWAGTSGGSPAAGGRSSSPSCSPTTNPYSTRSARA